MAARRATFVRFTNPSRSHYLATTHGSGGPLAKEEVHPVVEVTWNGATVSARFEASRYTYSNGPDRWNEEGTWSEWRIFCHDYDGSVTDTGRRAINDACRPEIEAWLESDEYRASRQRTAVYMLRRIIRDERTSAEGPRREVERHGHEVSDNERVKLGNAVDALDTLLALTSGDVV